MARKIRAFGEEKCIRDWSIDERCKVSYSTLRYRIKQNMAVEQAITLPLQNVGGRFNVNLNVGDRIHSFIIKEKFIKNINGQRNTCVIVDCACGNKNLFYRLAAITRTCGCGWKMGYKYLLEINSGTR